MQPGRDDENGQTHKTIKYIFGNQDTFNRILLVARKSESASGDSVEEKMRKAAGR